MNISFNTRDPVYLQVVRHFKLSIAKGILTAGEEIPSRRELASQLKINPNTVQRAYREMEEQKLIKTERNVPSKVTTDAHILQGVREELLHESISNFLDEVEPLQLPLDEIVSRIQLQIHRKGESASDD
ncbi:GntR family transcriptional regulator [Geomicrobium sp. JCM 19039]|uniref:GntR family transcriptional regulator n=1 Tax=Geomicrobium sp. JCM 19039 TaxID=1460636 RepID=UPI00045F294E|nr:GntR family transcriptional regulator [Geomicrobium sp. JCM 19039]GAK12637.1 transcriptional regulator, GntR family [Geomicrobium sp. JCM 19039]